MDISIVIPVYGSQTTLKPLTERLCAVLDPTGRPYEIIFVNDDSPDHASAELEALQSRYRECLVVLELTRNFGQHNAIMCGFHHARGRYVVTMDDDLQHPPEELPKLLAAIEETGLDVVYGRYDQKKHGLWRNLGSRVLNLVYRKVFGIAGQFTSFRVIRREIVQALLTYDLNFTFIDGLLAWNTRRIGCCTVEHARRQHGRSGYSLRKLVVLAVNLLTNFSLLPLQVSTLLGLFSACVGFLVGVYYLGIALLRRIAVPGYASTITAVLFLGGVQLLALGIVGEYVGRLHLNVNRKPQFRVRRRIGGGGVQETQEGSPPAS